MWVRFQFEIEARPSFTSSDPWRDDTNEYKHRFTWVFVWKLQLAGCCEARTFSTSAEVRA